MLFVTVKDNNVALNKRNKSFFNKLNNFLHSQLYPFLFKKQIYFLARINSNTVDGFPPFSTFLINSNIREIIKKKHPLIVLIDVMFIYLFWLKLRTSYYIHNWIYTTNHKRIAINYFWFVILSGIVGMVLATVIRLEFAYPGVGIFAGDSIQYLSLASAHGVIMVFFMIMPLLFGAFANFLLPTQLGVHDVAFPRLNSAAFWFLPGGLLMLCQLVCVDRRYQRMNCFNIREVQSLLKRKFFNDLINSTDHHQLLNKTAIGSRFKLQSINSINSNILINYNYGLLTTNKSRSSIFTFNSTINENNTYSFNPTSFFFKNINYLLNFNFFMYLNNFYFNFFFNNWSFINFNPLHKHTLISIISLFFSVLNFITSIVNFIINIITSIILAIKSMLFFIKYFFTDLFILLKIVITQETLLAFYNINNYLLVNNLTNMYHALHPLHFNISLAVETIYYFLIKKIEKIDFTDENFRIKVVKFFFDEKYFNQILFSHLWVFPEFVLRIIISKIQEYPIRLTVYNFKTLTDDVWILYNIIIISIINWIEVFKLNQKLNITIFIRRTPDNKNPASEIVKIKESIIIDNKHEIFYLNADHSFFKEFYLFIYYFLNFPYFLFIFVQILITKDFELIKKTITSIYEYITAITQLFFFYDSWWFISLQFLDDIISTFQPILTFSLQKNFITLNPFSIKYDIIFSYLYNKISTHISYIFSLDWLSYLNKQNLIIIYLKSLTYFEEYYLLSLNTIWFLLDNRTFPIFDYFYTYYINKINILSLKNQNSQTTVDLTFNSSTFEEITTNESNLFIEKENSETSKHLTFNNPTFKYDFKAGDYFPKLYKEIYTHLFSTFADLTSGLKTSPWFFSNITFETFSDNFNNFLTNMSKKIKINSYSVHSWNINKFLPTDTFYNFFFTLHSNTTLFNEKWLSLNSLNYKFSKLFYSSSMQQRIYNNWRQLKFTREAWRCKLLSARHQKTLFRRYVNEDGVFWSIERNAKDLIPGWAMITPFSSRTRFTAIGKTDIGLMGVLLVLNSSIISAANFLVTYRYLSTLNNRKMRDARAFFTEAVMVSSWMMILANPMLVIGIIMLLSDRHWQTSFFDYSGGGDTVLFQHMFWFFGHPEVYIIIIPTFGFTNTMISYYLKKRVSARASLLYSMYTIAFLGFFVWGHHMYMVGLAHTTRMLFSTLTVMISVPAATKIMHWCVTTVNSSFSMELPLLFTFTFIFFFVSGGISGMCVAHTGMDVLFHDTFYVIGHFHVMLAGGAMFASFGAFYFYFPAIFGVKYSRIFAYLHYTYYLIGQLMTVIPMFWLGYAGMPRRVLDYPSSFGGWHSVISAGHMLNVAGLIAFFFMIFDSLRQSRAATRNTFGIARFNTCLNFYLYEIARGIYIKQKSLFLFRNVKPTQIKLNKFNYINFEPLETTLFSYLFFKK